MSATPPNAAGNPPRDLSQNVPGSILFIAEYYPPAVMGGGEINLQLTAEALVKRGCRVSVLTSIYKALPLHEQRNGVHIYRRLKTGETPVKLWHNALRSIQFPSSIVREAPGLAEEIQPDLIHFIGNSVSAAPPLRKALAEAGKIAPFYATVESYPALCPKGDRLYHGKEECKIACSLTEFVRCQRHSAEIGKMKNRAYYKYNPLFVSYVYRRYSRLLEGLRCCRLIAISGYVQKLLKMHGMESSVVPNAFDLAPFFNAGEENKANTGNNSTADEADKANKADKAENTLKVLYVGAMIRSKGPQVLLEAIRQIKLNGTARTNDKGIRCELYGEGILYGQLQEFIKKNALGAEMFPPLPYEKMPQLYAGADIVAFPSLWPEPFGRIPIEVMAAGKALIASDIGAIPEIMAHAGLLVPPGDADALRQALLLLHDKTKREEYGKAARKAAQRYTQDAIAEKLLRAYQKL